MQAIGLEIAIPGAEGAAFERQTQAFFFFTQRLLGIFHIGDIDGGADVAQKVAGVGETRHAEGVHPAVFTVMAAQAKVGFERNAPVHRASA